MRELRLIVLHHSASKAESHTWDEIRAWHKAKGWSDIGYHFGVVHDPGGWFVKIGRPVAEVGAHAKGSNANSIGVCFEGNFSVHEMPPEQFDRGVGLLVELLRAYPTITEVVPHRETGTTRTECPGKLFPFNRMVGAVKDIMRGPGA